jgi:hypothetical protein
MGFDFELAELAMLILKPRTSSGESQTRFALQHRPTPNSHLAFRALGDCNKASTKER